MWYIYTMEYYSAKKRIKIMPFAVTWMDLEIVIQSEVSQRKTNIIYYHLYVESRKMVQMNLFAKQKQSHRCRKQTYGYQGGKGGGGMNCEIGIDIYTLVYMKQVTNENLLCNTGNSTQCSVVTQMGRESKKEWIYVQLIHFAVSRN